MSDGDNMLDSSEAPTGRRRDYVPSAVPGSRLPHMNVRLLSNPSSKVFQVRQLCVCVWFLFLRLFFLLFFPGVAGGGLGMAEF